MILQEQVLGYTAIHVLWSVAVSESIEVEDLSSVNFASTLEGNAARLRQWGSGLMGGGPTISVRVRTSLVLVICHITIPYL